MGKSNEKKQKMFLKSPGEPGSSFENKPEIQTPPRAEALPEVLGEKQAFAEAKPSADVNQNIDTASEFSPSVPDESTIETAETLEQFDHAKLENNKKAEAIALEHLLTDGEITGDNAFDALEAAEDLAAQVSK